MIQLSKEQAKCGDNLLKDLCEGSRKKEVVDYFPSEEDARFVCEILKEKKVILTIPTDSDPLYMVNSTATTCAFFKSGGLSKEYEIAEIEKKTEERNRRLEGWKYYAFWPVTILGAFGGIYSLIDLFLE